MLAEKKDLAETLRHAILTSGKSHYELEHASGVGMPTIGRFVRRQRTLTIETAAKLADALGLVLVPSVTKPKRATATVAKPARDKLLTDMEADINAALNAANGKPKRARKGA